MPDRDMPLVQGADIATALALLTRLPVPGSVQERGASAAWAYPLAGLAVGLIAALTTLLATSLGLSATLAAGLALAASMAATGAMHEDGLADSADGLWGGWDRARRLEIMRDSRIGTYGVLALILSVGLRWSALSVLIGAGAYFGAIVAAAILSRAPMAVLMHALPQARQDGLSHGTGVPSRQTAQLAAALGLGLGLLCIGLGVIAAAIWIALASLAVAAIARAKIGGQTGDILGACQQIAEIAALLALAASV